MSRIERLFGPDPEPEPAVLAPPEPATIASYTFRCSICQRTHATLTPAAGDAGYLLRFNPAGVGVKHVRETVYNLYCPDCGNSEDHDLPLPPEEYRRVLRARMWGPLPEDEAEQPFGD